MLNTSKSILEATASGFKQLFSDLNFQVNQAHHQPLSSNTLKRGAVEIIERKNEPKRLHCIEDEEGLTKSQETGMEEELESDEDAIFEIPFKKEKRE